MTEQIVYSKQKAWLATDNGTPHFVQLGEPYPADDPIVKKYPSMFADDPVTVNQTAPRSPVGPGATETASADPGERRVTNRPKP